MLTISLWTGDKSWAAAALPTTSLIGRDLGGCALIGRPGAGGYDEIYRVIRRPWWGHFSKQSHSSIETELPPICNSLSGLASHGRGASLDRGHDLGPFWQLPQVLHRLQNKEKPIRTTFTLRFGSLKMIFECSIARCDVGLGRAIVQCQKNPLRKPKLSINRAILSAHFSAVKFCIGFFCWIGFFWFCIGFFCNWMLQLLLKIVAKNLNYASLHVCT